MTQPDLFVRSPVFDGADLTPSDHVRLSRQMARVKARMSDGRWITLKTLAYDCGAPEASVSAQLRHLRKPRFGGHTIERRHLGSGLYEYRLVL